MKPGASFFLARVVEEFYGDENPELQIKIALLALGDNLRTDADFIFSGFRDLRHFNLDDFFTALFKLSFPAPLSTLDLGYRKLTQNFPDKSSIVEYSRKFRTFVKMLGLNLETQINKFLDGLADLEVRLTLRKNNLEDMDFRGVVTLAVNVKNNLSLEKTSRALWGKEGSNSGEETRVYRGREDYGDEEDDILLIMGTPLKKYMSEAEKWGLGRACFNCFNEHSAQQCTKECKFCQRGVRQARHYSILCPKRPRDMKKFFAERVEAKKKYEERKIQVKLAEESVLFCDFTDDDFE